MRVPQGGRGVVHRVARDEHARTREGAGVEAGPVGVGLHQVYPRRRGAEVRSPRSARARSRCPRRIRRCRRRSRRCRRRAASPTRPRCGRSAAPSRAASSRRRCRRASPSPSVVPAVVAPQGLVDEVDARGDAVLGERPRRRRWSPSASRASPGRTTLRRRSSSGSMPSLTRQLVDRGLHGERRLGHAVAAQRAAGHGVRVHRLGVEFLVGTTV